MHRPIGPYPPLLLAMALAACSDLPRFDATGLDAAREAPYPRLVPLERALASADTPPRFTEAEAASLRARAASLAGSVASGSHADPAARIARLRALAEVLRGPAATGDEIEAMRLRLAALHSADE